jgi:hypothetical protein
MALLRALVSCAAHRGLDCRPYATKYELVTNLKTQDAGESTFNPRIISSAGHTSKTRHQRRPAETGAGMAPPLTNSAHGDLLISAKPRGSEQCYKK